jgi:hypothetical protein
MSVFLLKAITSVLFVDKIILYASLTIVMNMCVAFSRFSSSVAIIT